MQEKNLPLKNCEVLTKASKSLWQAEQWPLNSAHVLTLDQGIYYLIWPYGFCGCAEIRDFEMGSLS